MALKLALLVAVAGVLVMQNIFVNSTSPPKVVASVETKLERFKKGADRLNSTFQEALNLKIHVLKSLDTVYKELTGLKANDTKSSQKVKSEINDLLDEGRAYISYERADLYFGEYLISLAEGALKEL
ncbi:uncharacterized protein [Periplaneta americana]|uniref:uncharacterized protein n=1 Tax=Periplaneta americana TaxID=6978 RepID=UPI0037E81007